jgi:hypothetical protein
MAEHAARRDIEARKAYKISVGNLKGRNKLHDMGINGSLIINRR